MPEFSRLRRLGLPVLLAACVVTAQPVLAQEGTGGSFVETFDKLDKTFWYVSDGWANGAHQNCTWSKNQVQVEGGVLTLGFQAQQTADRAYVCGEIQTRQRYGYGAYEIRMKAGSGSGTNSAFFTYIGPTDKKPHDEIDFEVLGKNTNQVQLNQYISGKGGNEKLVPVEGGADTAFHDYAFIWEKDRLRYFIDGRLVHEVTDPSKIPPNPQKIFASLWASDTSKQWLGSFSYAGPITMQVDRIAFTALGQTCRFPDSIVCTLD